MTNMPDSKSWLEWGIPLICISCILSSIIGAFIIRWYLRVSMYLGSARMDGKTVVITGGNAGIGKETAKDLAKRGAKVIILCRDVRKGEKVVEEVSEWTGSKIEIYQLDLASFESIRKCAAEIKEKEPKIHVLINNAGVMWTPQWNTKDGFEMQFGTNHLGHFLLTLLLLDKIKAGTPSRIINVSSCAHELGRIHWDDINLRNSYGPWKAYCQSKLANILFTKSLAEKLVGSGVTTYSLHPGAVSTEVDRYFISSKGLVRNVFDLIKNFFYNTPLLGAQTSIYCAVDEQLEDHSGKYYIDCNERVPTARARNMDDAERLWKLSWEMVDLKDFVLDSNVRKRNNKILPS